MGSKKSNNGVKNSKANMSNAISSPAHHSNGASASGSGIITDSRFASVHSDPRFKSVPRHKAKVEIDSRFDRVFTDRRFSGPTAPVDKRGKPRKKDDSENPMKNYYRAKEEEEEEEPGSEERKSDESETEPSSESDLDVSEEMDSDTTSDEGDDVAYRLEDDDEPEEAKEDIQEIEQETHRLAVVNLDWRHVKATDLYVILSSFIPKSGQILSVTIYPSEFGLERMKEEELHGPVGIFDHKKEKEDADADDEEEDVDKKMKKAKVVEEDEEELDNEKLRAYEKSRLRYYYAVVECDSVATADYLYKACDGIEFERSSNVFDLRFIPDSMEFKHPPRDIATEAPTNYEGLNFQTQALQHSKVQLSWDEDEPDRAKTLKRKLNTEQLEKLELKEYLASESESDEDDENEDNVEKKLKKRDMYHALLNSEPSGHDLDSDAEAKDNDDAQQDMEVTFNTGLEELSKRILEKKNRKEETVWEALLRERNEKKKLRRNRSKGSSDDESSDSDQEAVDEPGDFFLEEEPSPSVKKRKKSEGKSSKRENKDTVRQAEATEAELELLLADDTAVDTGIKGYNLKRMKVKGKNRNKTKETQVEEKIPSVVDDPRFSMIFTSPQFALDPTDPQFKRSATYVRQTVLKKQKLNKEVKEKDDLVPTEPQDIVEEQVRSEDQLSNNKKYKLATEIRSVKMRCQQIKVPSNQKASPTVDNAALKSTKKKDKKIHDNDLASMLKSVKKHSLSSKKR